MGIKLTDRFLTSRKAPLKGRAIYTDSIVPGLTFRVSAATASNPSGRRDWLLRYRPRRQAQKAVGLGTYPAVSLAKARERAAEIVAGAKRGIDLIAAEERDVEARRATEAKARPFCEIASAYLNGVKRLRSWPSIESRTRCHIIPKFGNKPVGEITRADVVEFLDNLERKQGLRHQVNRCRETLRAIFAFAIEREQITVNPILGISKRRVETPRDRTLNDDELTAIWHAIEKLPDLQRAYFRVVLLTGARRNEVREMAWSELDLDGGLWRLSASAIRAPAHSRYHCRHQSLRHFGGCLTLGHLYLRLMGNGRLHSIDGLNVYGAMPDWLTFVCTICAAQFGRAWQHLASRLKSPSVFSTTQCRA